MTFKGLLFLLKYFVYLQELSKHGWFITWKFQYSEFLWYFSYWFSTKFSCLNGSTVGLRPERAPRPREDPDDFGNESPKSSFRDFPGHLVVRTLLSNAKGMGSIPAWGIKIPHASGPKNRSNIVTNSIKTLKMVHIKRNKNLKINPISETEISPYFWVFS